MGLTVGRVPIGSSDFSLGPWTYDDESGTGKVERSSIQYACLNEIVYCCLVRGVGRMLKVPHFPHCNAILYFLRRRLEPDAVFNRSR